MLELPEAQTLARQIGESTAGKEIREVIVGYTPHKFAFFTKPEMYPRLLQGKRIKKAEASGGYVRVQAEGDVSIIFGAGGRILLHQPREKRPEKHQLLLEFKDGYALSVSIQMYGMIFCQKNEDIDNKYYLISRAKPSPLSEEFNRCYWEKILAESKPTLSAKGLLATEQRVPRLGNGVLQDILFRAGVHPKTKLKVFSPADRKNLFETIKETLTAMTEGGGRDTEVDLFGNNGGYQTLMSKKTVGTPCPICGEQIKKWLISEEASIFALSVSLRRLHKNRS